MDNLPKSGSSKYFNNEAVAISPQDLITQSTSGLSALHGDKHDMTETMSEATTMSSSFPQFAKLPPELRALVWKQSLPNIGPTLYPYKAGCWNFRTLPESDCRWEAASINYNLEGYFRYHMRIGTSYQIPAVLVNRESHAAVQAWLQETEFRLWRVKYKKRMAADDPANWTFERFFDRNFDIVYVAPEKWTLFIEEERDETERRQLSDVAPWPSGYDLPTAINLSTLMSKTYELKELVEGWWHRISELYVIMDGDGDGGPNSFNDAFDECWELETRPGGHFSYDILLERYDWKSDGNEAETSVARFIRQNLHSMNAGLAPRFEMLHDKIRGTYVTPPHDESDSAFDSDSDSDDVARRPGVDADLSARYHAANPYNIRLVNAVRRR